MFTRWRRLELLSSRPFAWAAGHAPQVFGMDGLKFEFYRTYVDSLAPRWTEVYIESGSQGFLPTSMFEVFIVSLPKNTNIKCKLLTIVQCQY